MSDEALITHFTAVADASAIPILIYNVPKFTHVNLRIEALRVLGEHPNIIGLKDSAGDPVQLEKFHTISQQGFQVLAGNASVWLAALSLGIDGGILALSNCVPDLCAGIQEFHRRGEPERAKQLHARLMPLNQAVTVTYGIAGLKYACDLMGYDGGNVRSPLMPLSAQGQKEIRSILTTAGLIPAG
jgi:4-hydroxy-2-oxoglutarate aldolase